MRTFVNTALCLLMLFSIASCSLDTGSVKSSSQAKLPRLPNIVFILADDGGVGDYEPYQSLMGNTDKVQLATPNLKKLAQQGMMFTQASASGSVCQPSRFGILTGLHAFRKEIVGVSEGDHYLIEPQRKTIADSLKQAGYRTGLVGKWHLDYRFVDRKNAKQSTSNYANANPHEKLVLGVNDYGFDYSFYLPKGISRGLFIENDHMVLRDQALSYQKAWPNTPNWEGHERWQFRRYNEQENNAQPFTRQEQRMMGDIIADKALDFIQDSVQNKQQPFFLYFALTAPHAPHIPADSVNGEPMASATQAVGGQTIKRKRERRQMVYETDVLLGQVSQQLERLGIADNTILVFTSDNGPGVPGVNLHGSNGTGNKKLRGQKGSVYEGGHRIPLVVRWPGKVVAGSVNHNFVSLIDFYRTFVDVSKHPLDTQSAQDSVSLLDELTSSDHAPVREFAFSSRDKIDGKENYFRAHVRYKHYSAIINESFREGVYVIDELYHLESDTGEAQNLIKNKALEPVKKIILDRFIEEHKKLEI